MKKSLHIDIAQPTIMALTEITYKYIPYWNGFHPLKMSLLLPKERKGLSPRPLLIWVCGGGFESMDKDVWLPELVFYARAGYIVASIEYRTHNLATFPGLLEDAKAAVRFLRAHAEDFLIDPERVAMAGESAGGYLTTMAGVTGNTREFDVGENLDQSSELQAVVNIYGRSDMVRGWYEKNNQGRIRNGTELLLGGKPDGIPEIYKKASASHYIRPDMPPFLLLHGTGDRMVPIEQNDLFYEQMTAAGNEVEYYTVEGAGHGAEEFYQPEIKNLVLAFLDKHLK
ncbi:MAG: prolyl oligopeptidase family serine peptidase [Christensenellaceae bacterium]|nr:prolyl oligopeptidase family serine peptidase [Christensenellaceae bacterium]